MKKTVRTLSLLACAGALCLGGCISPDLEPPGGGGNRLPSTNGAPGTVAERAAAAGTAATAVTSMPSNDAATKPGNAPMSGTIAGAPATAPAPGMPNSAAAGTGAPSTAATPPPTQTGAAGSAAGTGTAGDDADAGVGTP